MPICASTEQPRVDAPPSAPGTLSKVSMKTHKASGTPANSPFEAKPAPGAAPRSTPGACRRLQAPALLPSGGLELWLPGSAVGLLSPSLGVPYP